MRWARLDWLMLLSLRYNGGQKNLFLSFWDGSCIVEACGCHVRDVATIIITIRYILYHFISLLLLAHVILKHADGGQHLQNAQWTNRHIVRIILFAIHMPLV